MCYVKRDVAPYAVSLVNYKCDTPAHVLPVLAPHTSHHKHINFTVCVTPLNFHFNNVHQLVEMVEVNRILGAGKVVFYNHTSGPDVDRLLAMYVRQGVVDVIPWKVPVAVNTWPRDPDIEPQIHYFGQVVALNDCLYRYMFTSAYIVFTDLDEFIVPRAERTWPEMMAAPSLPCYSTNGAYVFQNTFFRTDWPDDEDTLHDQDVVRLKLLTLLKTSRETYVWPHYARSKYMVSPRLVVQAGIHFVFEFIDNFSVMQCEVPSSVGLLHHYRLWEDEGSKPPSTHDTYMYRYRHRIVGAVDTALHELTNVKP